ncbi:amino acid ABC transporter permease [Clostridium cochlearium]|uniref:amino acid ABC transporter permease n=1 Tax=Clostridium cochlearium TaxID=1494 RepID=UPI000BBBBB20|nr:amino acid ABC transporter permease [Clostridium cochlearium]MBE6065876.1 amino acid ABC transporter permease [Clostridium cochlearium]MBU5270335.1 amino acid ABC transporter permease [Clostridium cochlearium]
MDMNLLKNIIPLLIKATGRTVELTIISVILGSLIGVFIALLKLSKVKVLYGLASFYTWIIRGTPMLLQLYFFYYGLPFLGIELKAMTAAIIGLSLNSGAYMAEIIRGGILSVDKGQFEACRALGFTYGQTMKRIILPQAVRVLVPPTGNEFITILKDTSLVSVLGGMEEVMRVAQQSYSATFRPLEPFLVAACIYLILTSVFTTVFGKIEKKVSVY